MKISRNKIIGIFLIGLFWPALVWGADFYIEQDVVNRYKVGLGEDKRETLHQRMYVKGNNLLKIEKVEQGLQTIVRLDREVVYKINNNTKTYSEIDFKTLEWKFTREGIRATQADPQRKTGMNAARKGMSQVIQDMPVQQQQFIKQMMSMQQSRMRGQSEDTDKGSKAVRTVRTEESKSILGYQVKRLKIAQGEKKLVADMWVTTQTGPQNYLSEFIENLGLLKLAPINELRKIKGFPLEFKYKIQIGPQAGVVQSIRTTKIVQQDITSSI